MLGINIFLILPLVVTVRSQAAGIGYYGSSNVRNQGLNMRPINQPLPPPLPERVPVQPSATASAQWSPVPTLRPSYIPAYRPVLPNRPVGQISRPAPTVLPPVIDLEPASVPEREPAPQLEPVLQPETIPELEPILETTPQPTPIPEQETISEPEPYPQPEPLPDPIPEPIPIPEPSEPIPAPIPQPELSELIPEPIPQPKPSEPIAEPVPQPEPLEPIPQPELLPGLIPEPIPQPEPLEPIPQPELLPKPIPEPIPPIPESSTQPQPIPQPKPTLKPGSGGIALPSLLPKPKPERPPAFIPGPIYNPYPSEETLKPTEYPASTTEPQPEPTSETLPPATTVPSTTYKPIHGGHLVYGFYCNRGNGYYAVDKYCDSYIECKKNIAVRYYCPDGLHFNPAAKWKQYPCAYPSEVQCGSSSEKHNPRPTNECPRQYGFFSMKDGECSKYIICQEGKATVMDCPYGLAFNVETSSCDWPENVPLCNPYAFKDFECPESHVNQDGQISDFIYKYRYGVQCKLYVACQRGHPRLLSCDPGLLFDEPSQSCIDEDFVTNCATPYT